MYISNHVLLIKTIQFLIVWESTMWWQHFEKLKCIELQLFGCLKIKIHQFLGISDLEPRYLF